MRPALRRVARVILTSLLVASLGFGAWNVWQLATSPLGGMVVARGEAEIAARLERLLAAEVTPEALDQRLSEHLAANPRNWAAIDALTTLGTEQGIVPSAATLAALGAANAEDRGLARRAQDCLACAWDPAACDLSVIALCQVAVALVPFGDAVSVARESQHLVAGEDVDELDLALSTVGLAASLAVPLTAGTSMVVDAGAGVVRSAYRMGVLAPEVVLALRRAARDVIDWNRVAQLRPGHGFADDLAGAFRPGAVRRATAFFDDAGGLVRSSGTRDAIFLLGKAERVEDVKVLGAVAKPMGKRTAGTVEWAGMKRLGKIATRWADEVRWAVGSAFSALGAIGGLMLSASKSLSLKTLRRLAR